MPYIFVYGSLKSTEPNNLWFDADSKLIREAKSLPYYIMYDMEHFPYIRKSDPGYAIYGEIWEISEDTLDKLDCIEGHSYYRDQIQLEDWDKPIEAYFFRYNLNFPIVESGKWRSR